MSFLFFLPWFMILIPVIANEPVDWYKNHSYLATDTFLDIGVIMLLGFEGDDGEQYTEKLGRFKKGPSRRNLLIGDEIAGWSF